MRIIKKMGGSTSQIVGTNIVNDMVAQIFTTVALTCSNNAESVQNISVSCNPVLDESVPMDQREPYENQATCKNCIASVVAAQKDFYNLQQSSWRYGGKIGVNLPIDQDYTTVLKKMIACGSICKACVYQDLSQATVIKNVLGCQSMLTIENTIDQKLANSITQQLTNNQDFLPALAKMLGASNQQQIVSNLVSRISTKITRDVVTGVLNTIHNNQTMNLTGSSTDVTAQTQQSTYNNMVSYFQNTNLFSSIFQDTEWQVLQTLYNDQNTIDTLGNSVVKSLSDITKFMSSIVGKVVIAMLILVAVVFVSVLVIGLALYIKKRVAIAQAKNLAQADRISQLSSLERY